MNANAIQGRFYVYIHVRKTDGKVFYVGKGTGRRAWVMCYPKRSRWWVRTFNKHGREVIILKEGLKESCAVTIEHIMIHKYKSLGHPLVNHKVLGQRTEDMGARKIYASNGMSFDSVGSAQLYLNINGWPKASNGSIAACARGERRYAYGLAWSYAGIPKLIVDKTTRISKVKTDCGLRFITVKDAVLYLRDNGHPTASHCAISNCCRGKSNSSYGYKWSYDD